MKKKVIWAMTALLVLGLAGCKGKDDQKEEAAVTKASKDYVYKIEDLHLSEEEYNRSSLLRSGDKVYVYEYVWPEDGGNANIEFASLDENGNKTDEFQIIQGENSNYNNLDMDEEFLYAIKNDSYYTGERDPETGDFIGDEGDYVDEYYLTKLSLTGEEIYSVNLNEIPELQKLAEEIGYFNAYRLMVVGDYVYFNCCGEYVQFDKDGNYVKSIGNFEDTDSLMQLLDGRVVAFVWGEKDMTIAFADMEKGTLGEKFSVPGANYGYNFYAGMGYDLYLTDTYGMYGYNVGDTDTKQLFNYVDSDFDTWGVNNIIPIDEKSFFASYDSMEGGSEIAKFSKVDPADVIEKKNITLAIAYTDWGVRSEVIKFNKQSEEYRIQIQDYSTMYNTIEDSSIALTKLNADIASGKIPDILVLDDTMPIESYMNKGLFEDLKPYIEKDEALNLEDFMPNIVDICSKDGKLQILMTHFSMNTLMAKSSHVGTERGWTVQEAKDIWTSMPEGTEFLSGATKSYMLDNCIRLAASQFIDWETGKCNFNSDGFIQMLEFINMFPEEIDEDNYYTDAYWEHYDSMYRDDRVLTSWSYLSDFREFNRQEKGTFGEEVTLIGFPSVDGDGSVIMPGMEYVMSSKSANKDGVWAFLRNFLMEEYQSNGNGFPVIRKYLEKAAQEAMKKSSYEDENGERVEYDDVYYVGDVEIIIPPMTEQETKELMDILGSLKQVYRYDNALNQIISEEAEAFFKGQKRAQDVAEVIQSRAQIYVNETR